MRRSKDITKYTQVFLKKREKKKKKGRQMTTINKKDPQEGSLLTREKDIRSV